MYEVFKVQYAACPRSGDAAKASAHRVAILNARAFLFSVACLRSKDATLQVSYSFIKSTTSGDGEIRTLDPLLARQVLSQLSYTPTMGLRRLELPTSRLSGVRSNRLSYKPI